MAAALAEVRAQGIAHVVFGDLFLADVRAYREERLARVDGQCGGLPPNLQRELTCKGRTSQPREAGGDSSPTVVESKGRKTISSYFPRSDESCNLVLGMSFSG